MTANQSATAAAAAKVTKPKKAKTVSHAKPQEQGALPLPTVSLLPEFGTLAPDQIEVRDQVRQEFDQDALNELAMDIAHRGILQPLTVRKTETGFLLVAGERRLRAAKLAGLDAVPVLIVPLDDNGHALAQLAENIQRQDLNLKEEAAAVKLLFDALGDVQSVRTKLHKSASWVSKRLAIANGLGYWAASLLNDGITEDIELLNTVNALERETSGSNACWALCEKIKKGEAGREDAREALKRAKESKEPKPTPQPKPKAADSFPAANGFLQWCKSPTYWAAQHVDLVFWLRPTNQPMFEQLADKIKRLENEISKARFDRDALLKAECSEVTHGYGAMAINEAMVQRDRDNQENDE